MIPASRCGLLGLLWLGLAEAQVQVIEREQFYPVVVEQVAQLSATLNRSSPVREQGRVFHADTHTHLRWQYRWWQTARQCRLSQWEVRLTIDYRLPRLESAAAHAGVHWLWQRYYPALRQHEQQHGDLGRKAAHSLGQRLQALPAFADCQQLSSAANAEGEQILVELQRQHQALDLETSHGRHDGAFLDDWLKQLPQRYR